MIKAENIVVTYQTGRFKRKIKALNNFSINIQKGDIFALLGPNGAGKSTAMYCFLGLIKPDAGSISVLGTTPRPGSELFDKITYLPEEPHYHHYLTVYEAARFYSSLYNKKIGDSRINEVLERLSMLEHKNLQISHCSKGMKQKVGIAVCILSNAELVFLDEPTRGLDPLIVKEFRDILLEMSKNGSTIVLNSHILSEVEMTCNHAAIMNKGRVVVQDKLLNLIKIDEDIYTVEFSSTKNVPKYVKIMDRTKQSIKGEISTKDVLKFFKFTQRLKLKTYQCSLKRFSLEDTFYDYLKLDEE